MRTWNPIMLAAAGAVLASCAAVRAGEEPEKPSDPPAPAAPAAPAPAPEPVAPAPAGPGAAPQVVLDPSFRLPQAPGKEVSHMPGVVFTKDGARLIAGTSQGEIVVWNAATREIASRLPFADSPIAALAVDPAGSVLVALLENGALKAVDAKTGKTLAAIEKVEAAKTMAIAPDGKTLVIARGKGLEVRRIPDLEVAARVAEAHAGEVTGVDFAPGGKRLATVGRDGALVLWTFPALERGRTVAKGAGPLYAVAFSPDGGRVAFGGESRILHEVEAETGKERVLATGQPYWITTAGYSPDGGSIAIGDESCDVWVFDVGSAKNLFHSKHHVECWLSTVAWAPDGEAFLFGCRPNSHAGKPAIYEANIREEAAQHAEVKALAGRIAAERKALAAAYESAENAALRARVRALVEEKVKLLGIEGEDAIARGEEQVALGGQAFPLPGAGPGGGAGTIMLGTLVVVDGALVAQAGEAAPVQPEAPAPPAEPQTAAPQQVVLGDAAGFGNALAQKRALAAPRLTEEQRKKLEALDRDLAAAQAELRARPEMKDLLSRLEDATKSHVETLQKQCEELKKSFVVNQWRVEKAK